MTDETSAPLSVWLITLGILAVVGVVLAVLYLILNDPLSYLAGNVELSLGRLMAPRA
jgi:hypothetical protein